MPVAVIKSGILGPEIIRPRIAWRKPPAHFLDACSMFRRFFRIEFLLRIR